jgi:hypothetical protein
MAGRLAAIRPWAAALAGGLAGTTAMTVTLIAESRLRHDARSAVDYDASGHVVTAACRLVGRKPPASERAQKQVFNLVHWGYGSAVAVSYELLLRKTPNQACAVGVFYAGAQSMAFVLFPAAGGTPPPWRWERALLESSLGAHAIYAVTVAVVSRQLGGRRRAHAA